MNNRIVSAALALIATATAVCLSAIAGMQRGGLESERAPLIAVGVVLVVAAHLIPALMRGKPASVRVIGFVIWAGAMAATCYGHATFFLFASIHAGDLRASNVTASVTPGVTASRDFVTIAHDRATAEGKLAQAKAERCYRTCPELQAKRARLAGELHALDVERDMAERELSARDRVSVERKAAARDPMTDALGIPPLLVGMLFAAVLEGVACLCWTIALAPAGVTAAVTPVTERSAKSHDAKPPRDGYATGGIVTANQVRVLTELAREHVAPNSMAERVNRSALNKANPKRDLPVAAVARANADASTSSDPAPPDDDIDRARAAVEANELRPTVIAIRQFLRCSQTRASEIARLLKDV
ncbi:hypothetical protein [Burkholderia sp. USMB20]|uniref:hypothetical protein n=1 Tax=Burkholderia sp. USMB20 TaxID=1571773 RepID=UPI0005CE3C6B|nr:hypothetical protein [Burkholderia sp. USMB20]TGN96102.1 hypothetical protein PL79_018825 [Burkholderia sp. USMB20]